MVLDLLGYHTACLFFILVLPLANFIAAIVLVLPNRVSSQSQVAELNLSSTIVFFSSVLPSSMQALLQHDTSVARKFLEYCTNHPLVSIYNIEKKCSTSAAVRDQLTQQWNTQEKVECWCVCYDQQKSTNKTLFEWLPKQLTPLSPKQLFSW